MPTLFQVKVHVSDIIANLAVSPRCYCCIKPDLTITFGNSTTSLIEWYWFVQLSQKPYLVIGKIKVSVINNIQSNPVWNPSYRSQNWCRLSITHFKKYYQSPKRSRDRHFLIDDAPRKRSLAIVSSPTSAIFPDNRHDTSQVYNTDCFTLLLAFFMSCLAQLRNSLVLLHACYC